MTPKMIGIVGGIGSYAGIDLVRKIYDYTGASCDQEHLPISLLSVPHSIEDRTEFILGKSDINPGVSISHVIAKLADQGAELIGIPCNTAHAPVIYDVVAANLPASCKLLHMIREVAAYLQSAPMGIGKVGVLATTGTIHTDIYKTVLSEYGLEVVYPSGEIQALFVHPAIYNPAYGLKAFSSAANVKARNDLLVAASFLVRKGVDAIILGCTEIPLVLTEQTFEDIPLIDATAVLAKALIRESQTTQPTHQLSLNNAIS